MRVVATPKTALERQIWESVAIDRLSGHSPNACLNLKSEWGHSRTPTLVNKEYSEEGRRKELGKKGSRPREREKEGNEEGAQDEGRENGRKSRTGSQEGKKALRRQKKRSRPLLWQQGLEGGTRRLRKWQKEEKTGFGQL